MPVSSAAEIVDLASKAAFGRPLVTNVHRAIIVEAIVSTALSPEWQWCASDYAAFDFQHIDGTRLEVKQSAARQSWAAPRPSTPRWDIRARTGFWEGSAWIDKPGRNADLYVFAHHPVTDQTADHREPSQWLFYVAEARRLSAAMSIGISPLLKIATAVAADELASMVDAMRTSR